MQPNIENLTSGTGILSSLFGELGTMGNLFRSCSSYPKWNRICGIFSTLNLNHSVFQTTYVFIRLSDIPIFNLCVVWSACSLQSAILWDPSLRNIDMLLHFQQEQEP